MAERIEVRILDDIDGTDASEVHELAFDGERVELELSEENSLKLRALVGPWMKAGRNVGRYRPEHAKNSKVTPIKAAQRRVSSVEERDGARAYARKHGVDVGTKGRVEACVMLAYRTNQPLELRKSRHWQGE